MGYDSWLQEGPGGPSDDHDCCEECGDPKRYDRILKRDLCSCDDAEYFTEPDDDDGRLDEAACFGGVEYP